MDGSRVLGRCGRFVRAAVAAVLLAALCVAAPTAALADETPVTLKRTSWDMIGVDSNIRSWTAATPRRFPVSRRVCNTGVTPLSGVTATISLGAGDPTHVRVVPGWPTTLDLGTLAPGGEEGACREATFGVVVGHGAATPDDVYGKTRGYTLSVTAPDLDPVTNSGTLTVQKLVSQNRNKISSISSTACVSGVCAVDPGDTVTFVLASASASAEGYDGIQTQLDLPLNLVDVLDVETVYPAPKSATVDGVFGDGCGGGSDGPVCTGDRQPGGGKTHDIVTTYTVRGRPDMTAGAQAAVSALIYDRSGASYHYNDDFADSLQIKALTAPAADIAVTVTAPAAASTTAPLDYLITVANLGPAAATGVQWQATVPVGAAFGKVLTGATGDTVADATVCPAPSAGKVTCAVGELAAAGTAVYRLRVQPDGTKDPVATTVQASADQADPDAANNTAKASSCISCGKPPVVTFGEGAATAVTEHATQAQRYTFTVSHPLGIDLLTTSCGDAGTRVDGSVGGAIGDVERTGTVDCVFDDGGTGRSSKVTVTATQGETNAATATLPVSIANAVPTGTFDTPVAVELGEVFTVGMSSAADDSATDTAKGFTYRFDCGTGSGASAWSATASASCTAPADRDTVGVAGWVRDKDGGETAISRFLAVVGNATVTFTDTPDAPETTVNEGSGPHIYSFSASHTSGIHSLEASCGTGGTLVKEGVDDLIDATTRNGWVTCAFDDGVYANGVPTEVDVAVTATPVVGKAVTKKLPVAVANVAPKATISAPLKTDAGDPFTLALQSPSDPSSADTKAGFAYRFDCGAGYGDWDSAASVQCKAPASDATLTVRAEIRDKDGEARETTRQVTVALPTGALALTNPERSTTAGVATSDLVVELRDAEGAAVQAGSGGKLLRLASTSLTGTFHTADGKLDPLTTVTVPAGAASVAFRYRDTAVGTPTITVHDQVDLTKDVGLADASQPVAVHPAAAKLVLEGATGTLYSGSTRTFTARIVDAAGATITAGPDAAAPITVTQSGGAGKIQGLDTVSATSGGVAKVTITALTAGPVTLKAAATASTGALASNEVAFAIKLGGKLLAAPSSLRFPATLVGSTTTTLPVTVTNTGDEAVSITGITLVGANAADFAASGPACAAALAPGASCVISVQMTPSADGPRAATLRVSSAAGDLDVALEGIGGTGNRAPTLSISITPDKPLTDDLLKATVQTSDPDGDRVVLSYAWKVNGVALQTIAKTSALTDDYDLSQTGSGDVGNLVTVVVTATDGVASTSASKTLRVGNSAPVAHDRTALVRKGTESAAISLLGSDPDDHTLAYQITSLPSAGSLRIGADKVLGPEDKLPFTVKVSKSGTDLFPSEVTYLPAGDAVETSFTFRALDGDPVQPLESKKDGKVTIGVYTSPEKVAETSDGAGVVKSDAPSLVSPLQTMVKSGTAGLAVTIEEQPQKQEVATGSTYKLLDIEQVVHIKQVTTDGEGKVTEEDAHADPAAPFELTFRFLTSLLADGVEAEDVVLYRNGKDVAGCEEANEDLPEAQHLPQDEQPCWSDRDTEDGVHTITVLTLQASNWNFAVPVPEDTPDTAILSAYQGVTSAGAPNDKGAPDNPIKGRVEGFSFSSDDPDATFECRLTRVGAPDDYVYADFDSCVSGGVGYDVIGTDHPDGLYTFEVRAVRDAGTDDEAVDPSPARRDFVIDRSAVSITLIQTPAATHDSTTATFGFESNKPGTEFQCMVRTQTGTGGEYSACDSPLVRAGLVRGESYEFNVKGTDDAKNTGTASWLFSISAAAGDGPPAPPPVVTPGDDDDDDDDDVDPRVGGSAPGSSSEALERIAGGDRIATAAELALRYYSPGLAVVYVARSDDFPDALTGGPLAAADGGPILLVTPRHVPEDTAAALRILEPGKIVVLGGTDAVGETVAEQLGLFAPVVERIRGRDRFGTAAQISRTLYPGGARLALISTGFGFPDALSAGAAAAALGGPVLLVSDELPEATAQELVRLGVERVMIVGGPSAVSPAVAARIAAVTGAAIERVGGPTRYDTAAALSARAFPPGTPTAFVATGERFADALTATAVAGKLGSPLLIVERRALPPGVAEELHRVDPDDVVLLGGTQAVGSEVELAIAAVLG